MRRAMRRRYGRRRSLLACERVGVGEAESSDHRFGERDVRRRRGADGRRVRAGQVEPFSSSERVASRSTGSRRASWSRARSTVAVIRPAVKRATNRGAVSGSGRARRAGEGDGCLPLPCGEVHVDQGGVDDGVAERTRWIAAKTVGELGCGLELAANEQPAVQRRRRAGSLRSASTPARRRWRARCRPRSIDPGAPGSERQPRGGTCRSSCRTLLAATRRHHRAPRLSACSVSPTSKRTIVSMALASAQRWAQWCCRPRRGSDRGRLRARRTTSPRPRARGVAADRAAASSAAATSSERLAQCSARSNRQNIRSAWARPANVKAAPVASRSPSAARRAAACAYVSALSSMAPDDQRNRPSRS